jgi:hypothetical protein
MEIIIMDSGIANFLFHAHSGLRWLVVLATIIALAWMLLGLLQKRAYDSTARRIMLAFAGLVTLQWLVGLILFLVMGGFDVGYRWEHAVIMTAAVAVSHMHNRWKNAPDALRYRNSLLIVIAALALVFIGVARLPGGEGLLGGWVR